MPGKPTKEEILNLLDSYEGNILEQIHSIDVNLVPMVYHLEGVVWFNEELGVVKIPCTVNSDGEIAISEEFGFRVELPTIFAPSGEIETFGALIFKTNDVEECIVIEKIASRINAASLRETPRISPTKVLASEKRNEISNYSGKRLIIFPEKMVWREGVVKNSGLPNKNQITLKDSEEEDLGKEEKIESIKSRSAMYFQGKLVKMLFICGPDEQYDVSPQETSNEDEADD